jgi:hypothetical protein
MATLVSPLFWPGAREKRRQASALPVVINASQPQRRRTRRGRSDPQVVRPHDPANALPDGLAEISSAVNGTRAGAKLPVQHGGPRTRRPRMASAPTPRPPTSRGVRRHPRPVPAARRGDRQDEEAACAHALAQHPKWRSVSSPGTPRDLGVEQRTSTPRSLGVPRDDIGLGR